MTDLVAVAFTPAPARDSPNLRTDDALTAFHRLLEVCFAALRRWNPDLPLALATSAPVEGRLAEALVEHAVGVRLVPFAHRPPAGFHDTFNASLYTLDALEALLGRPSAGSTDRLLLLDPDVVCARPLGQVFEHVEDDAVLAYDLHLSPWHPVQGLSILDARLLHARLDPELTGLPRHYGGELYGFTPASWRRTSPAAERAWHYSLERFEQGLVPRFVTEEHLLNFALHSAPVQPANDFVRRIWTAPTHRTVTGQELGLALWHLPAEKSRGLPRLHDAARDRESWFWTADGEEWRARAGRLFGIPGRPPARLVRDVAGRTVRRAQRRIAGLPAPRRPMEQLSRRP